MGQHNGTMQPLILQVFNFSPKPTALEQNTWPLRRGDGEFHSLRLHSKSAILQPLTERRNLMKIQRLLIVLTILNLALLLALLFQARPTLAQSVAPVLRGKGLEI